MIGVDATRRKPALAATASALDKAMGFLQKYRKEGSSTPTTTLGNEQTSNGRRWSAANASSDDEDDVDISLDSDDDDGMSRKVAQRAKSRLKPNRTPPASEPSRREESARKGVYFGVNRSLPDVPPSDHIVTARDLGITASDGLDQPQTTVSGVDVVGFRTRHQTNTCLPQESRTPDLRFTGSTARSPSSGMVSQGHGSDSDCVSSVKTVISTVVEDIQPEEHDGRRSRGMPCSDLARSGEIDAGGGSDRDGTKMGQGGERSRYRREDDSLHTTAEELIPRHSTNTIAEATGDDCGKSRDRSGEQVPDAGEDDDSYEDDDFEEVGDDPLESSDRDLDGGEAILCEENRDESEHSPAISATPMRNDDEAGTFGWKQGPASVIRPSNSGVHGREDLSFDETRKAWDQGTCATSPVFSTSMKGNNLGKYHEVPAISNVSNYNQNHLPTTKEAWMVEGRAPTPSAPMGPAIIATQCTTGSSSQKQALDGGGLDRVQQALASVEGVSKGGVRIDRSAEVCSPQRPPPHSAIKTICSNAVASVEFAHDPDRELDLRSIGTQVRHKFSVCSWYTRLGYVARYSKIGQYALIKCRAEYRPPSVINSFD